MRTRKRKKSVLFAGSTVYRRADGRWADIDFQQGTLQVRHTVDFLGGYGYLETEPKTKSSRRKLVLPEFLLEMLKHHRVQQLEQRLKIEHHGKKWIWCLLDYGEDT